VRREIGLTAAPHSDPDVVAGRLRVGDRELQRRLYPPPETAPVRRAASEAGVITGRTTAWRIAGRAYARGSTVYVFPDGTRSRGDEIGAWDEIPDGTRVLLDQPLRGARAEPHAPTAGLLLVSQRTAARDLLGTAAVAETTSYLLPSGAVRSGAELAREPSGQALLRRLPAGTRVLVGYVNAGRVEEGDRLTRVAGRRWNSRSTYYRVPGGGIRTGVEIDDSRVPAGTMVFFQP